MCEIEKELKTAMQQLSWRLMSTNSRGFTCVEAALVCQIVHNPHLDNKLSRAGTETGEPLARTAALPTLS